MIKCYPFKFDVPPVPLARPRLCRGGVYDPQVKQKKIYKALINEQLPTEEVDFLKSAPFLYFDCVFAFKMTVKLRKRSQVKKHMRPREQKPDVDNLIKFILDAFNPFLKDDSCVYACKGIKLHTMDPSWSQINVFAFSEMPDNFDGKDPNDYIVDEIRDMYHNTPIAERVTMNENCGKPKGNSCTTPEN